MNEPAHSLSQPLPPDVAAGESAFIRYYQRYTVYSWPWAWRRTALFGFIGVLGGVSFGASHGLYVRDVGEGRRTAGAVGVAHAERAQLTPASPAVD